MHATRHSFPAATALIAALVLFANSLCAQLPGPTAPFTGVRWEGEQPIVCVDGEWYGFEGLDNISRADLVAYAKREYGDQWQERFSEDLDEVLAGMGHTPSAEVTLTLSSDGQTITKTVRMTAENRRAAWQYNRGIDDSAPHTTGAMVTPSPGPTSGADPHPVAVQFAANTDRMWDQPAAPGSANLRFVLSRGGTPFAGRMTLETEFTFTAGGGSGQIATQGFNPNANGRWIYQGLQPGTYDLILRGSSGGRLAGWTWRRQGVVVADGDSTLFEIDLDQ